MEEDGSFLSLEGKNWDTLIRELGSLERARVASVPEGHNGRNEAIRAKAGLADCARDPFRASEAYQFSVERQCRYRRLRIPTLN